VLVNALHLGYGDPVPLNRQCNDLIKRGIGCSIEYETRLRVIHQRELTAPTIPDATPSLFLNEADTADATNMINAFADICKSPFKFEIVKKLKEIIITAKQDVISIALARREQPIPAIPFVDEKCHLVAKGRWYDPLNPAGQSYGKGADLAVLLKSNGEPAVDLPPGYVRVENSEREIILSAWMAFILSGGHFKGSFVPNITGNVMITWKSNYFWARCNLGEPWGTVCVVMLPYNLLANGLAIVHPKTVLAEDFPPAIWTAAPAWPLERPGLILMGPEGPLV
jgi:hypothetical protein